MEKQKFLIVVDMQNDFIDGSLGTKEAQAIVPAAAARIRACRDAGYTVIATLDTHEENYPDTREGRFLPVLHCVRGTEGWQINAAVAEALGADAVIVDKPTFGSTELLGILGGYAAQYGEENVHIELIGLCTDICVVSNALLIKAHFHEMPLSLDPKCCAGVTPEKHAAAIETMRSCQIEIR